MHGLTESAYQEELAKARAEDDNERVTILQTAKDIVEHFEFHDMRSMVDLKLALATAQQKVEFADIILKPRPGSTERRGYECVNNVPAICEAVSYPCDTCEKWEKRS
jgi:hypothetical protein